MKKPKLLEKDIRDPVVEHAKHLGFEVKRNVFRQGMATGWPDDTIYGPLGRVLEVEFKAPGKTPSRRQSDRIARLRDAGHMVLIVDNVAFGKTALNYMQRHNLWGIPVRTALDFEEHLVRKCDHRPKVLVADCVRLPD